MGILRLQRRVGILTARLRVLQMVVQMVHQTAPQMMLQPHPQGVAHFNSA